MNTHRLAVLRPVIFLDMDDVLCISNEYNSFQVMMCFRENQLDWPELWAGLVDAGTAKNLQSLHQDFNPQYVVSSSWANYLDRSQMCEVFARTQLDYVSENLHGEWKTPRAQTMSRREEIEAWLKKHHTVTQPILVLDDTDSGSSLIQSPLATYGCVIFCDRYIGFSEEKLISAQQSLLQQCSEGGITFPKVIL